MILYSMKPIRILSGIVLIAILGLSLMIGTSFLAGTHTKYCPWGHVLLNTESCAVRDQRAGQVLIEHHDTDNMYNHNNYLEIREGLQSYTFRIPGPTLSSLELIPGEHATILINGNRQELIPF
jgi:hypothetical protein